MTDFDAIFKAYDIRGLVPEQIDADGARAIGAAYAASFQTPKAARKLLSLATCGQPAKSSPVSSPTVLWVRGST